MSDFIGTFQIVGWMYRSEESKRLLRDKILKPGSYLKLELEPDNPKDPNAIKIMAGEHCLGYIARTRTGTIRELMKKYKNNLVVRYAGAFKIRLYEKQQAEKEEKVKKLVKDENRQRVRIIPTVVQVKDGILYLNNIPYEAKITPVKNFFVAETKHFIAIVNSRDKNSFRILDKEYKVMPKKVYVAGIQDNSVTTVASFTIQDWVIRSMHTSPTVFTMNVIAKAWGELRSRELNIFPGMAYKTDENGNIITNFKKNQIAARFQLFRPTDLPYVVIVLGGYNLVKVLNLATDVNPITRTEILSQVLERIIRKKEATIIPSAVGTILGDIFSKVNVLPDKMPFYPEEKELMLKVRVWNSQKLLGLGAGSVYVRSDLQHKLSRSSINRTVTVRVKKDLFIKYIYARRKIEKNGLVRSFKITNHIGERVSLIRLAQKTTSAVDPWYNIYQIDLFYNARENGYYIKFYIRFSYHAIRTGDKLLSYEKEFFKGVAVVAKNIPADFDMECTWDNIKGTDYRLVEHKNDYSVILINANALFVVERGTSNVKRPNYYSKNAHDAYETMVIHEHFPELAKEIYKNADPRLTLFPDAYQVFIKQKVTVHNKIEGDIALIEIQNFLRGNSNMFDEDFPGGYVEIKDRMLPLPSTNLIMGLANEYDSGIAHSALVLRYMKTLAYFLSYDMVLEKSRLERKYEPNLGTFRIYAENMLYRFFKSPRLFNHSSIKRIINHMHDVMPGIVAVKDDDYIFSGRKEVFGVASVYPSVHPLQVKHKFIKIVPYSRFQKMYKEITGEELNIATMDDAVLMNPHLVNSVFIKDNDGDALALRVLSDQELGRKIYNETVKDFHSDLTPLKAVAHKTEIWRTLAPKEPTPYYSVTEELTLDSIVKGINSKLMIGMITRQGRKVQFVLDRMEKILPAHRKLFAAASLQIAHAIQNVIDGLKHEKDIIGANLLYAFLRDINNLDWNGVDAKKNRARILGNFEKSGLVAEFKKFIPMLKKRLDDSKIALAWMFGDKLPDGVSLGKAFSEFGAKFPLLIKIYFPAAKIK